MGLLSWRTGLGGTKEERCPLIATYKADDQQLVSETYKLNSVVGSRSFHNEVVFRLGFEG